MGRIRYSGIWDRVVNRNPRNRPVKACRGLAVITTNEDHARLNMTGESYMVILARYELVINMMPAKAP